VLHCTLPFLGGQHWDRPQASVLGSLSYAKPRFVMALNSWTFSCFKYFIELAVLRMYCKVAIVIFWKITLTFWELLIIFTKEMFRNVYYFLFFIFNGE